MTALRMPQKIDEIHCLLCTFFHQVKVFSSKDMMVVVGCSSAWDEAFFRATALGEADMQRSLQDMYSQSEKVSAT